MAANEVTPPLPPGFEIVEPKRPPLPAAPVNRSNQAAQTLGGAAPAQPTGLPPRAPQAASQAAAAVPPLPPGFELQDPGLPAGGAGAPLPMVAPPLPQADFATTLRRGLDLAAAGVAGLLAPVFGMDAAEEQRKIFERSDAMLGARPGEAPVLPQSGGLAGDSVRSLVSGSAQAVGAITGLADIVSGGRAGRGLEAAGFNPTQASEMIGETQSPEMLGARQEFDAAEGFTGKLGAAVSNPRLVLDAAVQSAPGIVAGGLAGRGIKAAAAGRVGTAGAAAAGEGALIAGGAAQQIRSETEDGLLTAGQTAAAVGTGVVGTVFGRIGLAASKKLGFKDVDEMVVRGTTSGARGSKQVLRQVLQGAVAEGVLEEMPQSISEQVLQNLALGRPIEQGVDSAAVMGLLTGASIGGTVNAAKPAVEATTQAATGLGAAMRNKLGPAPTSGTQASAGAAGTDAETVRRQRAASLPVPVELTKGQATREAKQQQFEKQQFQDADTGKALRDMTVEQTDRILKNFDALEEQTGATRTSSEGIGESVVNPIEARVAAAKAEIRAAYKQADDAGETAERVSADPLVQYLNDERASAINAPIIKAAGDRLVQLEAATRDEDGRLVAGEISLGDLEKIRQSIGADAGLPGTPNAFRASQIKERIDAATKDQGGDLYRRARKLYSDYAGEFKNQAAIRDLIANKSGTTDRKIALESVYAKTVKNGTVENLRRLQDTLIGAGEPGQQALRELRGAAVRDIREQATRTTSVDEAGQKVPSVAGLQRAVKALDKDGKLELLFGKAGAQTFRDLGDLASDIYTAPPGLVNSSGTAVAVGKLMADWAGSMAVTGIPAPLLTIGKSIKNWRAGRKTRAEIADALKQPDGLIAPGTKPDLDARPFDAASVAREKTVKPMLAPKPERPPETARVIELRKQKSILESIKKCLES